MGCTSKYVGSVPLNRLAIQSLLVSAGLLLTVGVPQAAGAGMLTTQSLGAAASPAAQPSASRSGASLRIDLDTAYDDTTPPFTGKLITANLDLDDDFLVDPAASAQCDPTAPGFSASTTADALAACGAAKVG